MSLKATNTASRIEYAVNTHKFLGPVDKVLLPMRVLPLGGRHGDT